MLFERTAKVIFTGINVPAVEGLRIAFQVDKSDGQSFNHGSIRVYNLAANTRNALARTVPYETPLADPVVTVSLFAGYVGNAVNLITGDLLSATNYRAGPDWITEMEIYSGMAAAMKSIATVSYNGRTSSKKVLEDILAPMKIDIKYTAGASEALQGQSVPGYTADGKSMAEANNFLSRYNLEFTLEEQGQGLVYAKFKPRDQQTTRTDTNSFTPKNGLIGTPKITRDGAEFRSLLRPGVKLLQRVFIESQTISATIQNSKNLSAELFAKKITHTGDTRADEWYTDLQGFYASLAPGFYNYIT